MEHFFEALPLIGAILGIIVSVLTISKFFRDIGIFRAILTLTIVIFPVVFIQQIVLFTYDSYKTTMIWSIIFSCLYVVIYFLRDKKLFENGRLVLDSDITPMTFTALALSSIVSLITYRAHNDIMAFDIGFIDELKEFKISYEMFLYLFSNTASTLLWFIRFVQVVLADITLLVYVFFLLASDENHNYRLQKSLGLYTILISVLIPTGIIFRLYRIIYALF